jgi:predicted alpha/beta-fold hydrolase
VKSFTFRLDRVLHWRATQAKLQEARTAAAAGRVADLRRAIDLHQQEKQNEAKLVTQGQTGAVLASYAGFYGRSERQSLELGNRGAEAQKVLNSELSLLQDAGRKVRLLEKLKKQNKAKWEGEFDRETAAFADEAFLVRLQSGKRTGA